MRYSQVPRADRFSNCRIFSSAVTNVILMHSFRFLRRLRADFLRQPENPVLILPHQLRKSLPVAGPAELDQFLFVRHRINVPNPAK